MLQRFLAFALLFALLVRPAARGAIVAVTSVDWPAYNNDSQSDRYAALGAITTGNVGRLRVVCTAKLGGPANFQTGPIVINGVLYVTRANQTFALDAATCAARWTNTYATSDTTQQSRGLGYANGLLYRGFADGHVIAINAGTGATRWNQPLIAAGSSENIAAAPITWNGTVFVGTENGERPQACHLFALAGATGKVLWSQRTVPAVGTPDAKTWQGATLISGGSMWTSFSLDPATGYLYVPLGNPEADFDYRQRKGADLPTDSILQLVAANGTVKGGFQTVAQDVHDWDQASAPAIVTPAGGTKMLLTAGKDGYLRSISLTTLAQRWQTAVTTIENAASPISTSGTHYCPWAGVLWNGPAYSPLTGLAYVNATDWCNTLKLAPTPQPPAPGKAWTGAANDFGSRDAANSGWLSAVAATTGAVRWRYHSPTPLLAGVTPTAGGLVFTADLRGNVLAFNAVTGALLASVATKLPVGGGVISYETGGTQYVAVAAGLSSGNFLTADADSTIVVLGLGPALGARPRTR